MVTDHIKQNNFERVFYIMHYKSKYIKHLRSKECNIFVFHTLLNSVNIIEFEINRQSSYDHVYYPVKC